MADDAAPTTPPHSSPSCARHPFLPSDADGHQSPVTAPTPLIDTDWPVDPMLYQFFYVWESEAGVCCPGAESLQGAISTTEVQLLCLACDKVRTARSHQAEVII